MSELLRIQTSISNTYLKSLLWKGFGIAFIGALSLVLGSVFISEPLMKKWGGILYFSAFLFITLGLLPYRKITRLQNKPNEIRVTENDHFEFWSKNELQLEFPLDQIQFSEFIENKKFYGIRIQLKQESPNLFRNLRKFHVLVDKKNKTDLTFLYFTKRSYKELYEIQSL